MVNWVELHDALVRPTGTPLEIGDPKPGQDAA